MFIGGLNWETTDRMPTSLFLIHLIDHLTGWLESLRDYFSQFGEVAECTVMRDGATGRSRGFGFLTFKDPKCVNTVMVKEHYLDGKIVSLCICHDCSLRRKRRFNDLPFISDDANRIHLIDRSKTSYST